MSICRARASLLANVKFGTGRILRSCVYMYHTCVCVDLRYTYFGQRMRALSVRLDIEIAALLCWCCFCRVSIVVLWSAWLLIVTVVVVVVVGVVRQV